MQEMEGLVRHIRPGSFLLWDCHEHGLGDDTIDRLSLHLQGHGLHSHVSLVLHIHALTQQSERLGRHILFDSQLRRDNAVHVMTNARLSGLNTDLLAIFKRVGSSPCTPRSIMEVDIIMAETKAYHRRMRDKYDESLTLIRDTWHALRRELETETDPVDKQWLQEKAMLSENLFAYNTGMREYHIAMVNFWEYRVDEDGAFIPLPRRPSRTECGL